MPDLTAGVPVASNQPRTDSNEGHEKFEVRSPCYSNALLDRCLCHVRYAWESHPVCTKGVPGGEKEMLQTKTKA